MGANIYAPYGVPVPQHISLWLLTKKKKEKARGGGGEKCLCAREGEKDTNPGMVGRTIPSHAALLNETMSKHASALFWRCCSYFPYN